jgi:hypothetical protein
MEFGTGAALLSTYSTCRIKPRGKRLMISPIAHAETP